MNISDETLKKVAGAIAACEREDADPHNDFGDVGYTLEKCEEALRGVLADATTLPTVETVEPARSPGQCPHCPAKYSTEQEVQAHLGRVGGHVLDRVRARLDKAPVSQARDFLSGDSDDWHHACLLLCDLADAIDAVKGLVP